MMRWKNVPRVYVVLFLLSASILSFEIVATRIASVIFVQDYAFITLSLALLGVGCGGVYSYSRIKASDDPLRTTSRALIALGVLLCLFITATIEFPITNPFIFLLFVILPFFSGGIAYAQVYRSYSTLSFRLYASDLSGAAVGAVASLGLISVFGAANSVIVIALVVFAAGAFTVYPRIPSGVRTVVVSMLGLFLAALLYNGQREFLGKVPIGEYPEKDFYSVYPNAAATSTIIDSRWSIYGRADLVQYSDQNMVQQLFVDGAAGTQVYRFNGNVRNTHSILQALLLQHTNAIPFLCLTKEEKRSMLVIGPGGGNEILLGLFGEAGAITGVEVNPDFVNIVKDHKIFDGGIYTDFPNVRILVEEGRHFVKRSSDAFDLVVMALPSTAQMQNIEPFATSENYLLTKEAIRDYLRILTPEGKLIFTVHNEWELTRLIATVVSLFQDSGMRAEETRNHFVMFEAAYAPTVVIKKSSFAPDEAERWRSTCLGLPRGLPPVTYLPYGMIDSVLSPVGKFLVGASRSPDSLQTYIRQSKFDISPCTDDQPYFYKIFRGIPGEFSWLLVGTVAFNLLVMWLPSRLVSKKGRDSTLSTISLPLAVLACTGAGFMVLEVSLFQKLVLYLGSPTISLSILLSSLLIGMGIGSAVGRTMFGADARRRLWVVSVTIVAVGILLFMLSPMLLSRILAFDLPLRAATSFLIVLPLALFLGIPFPSCIQLMTTEHNDRHIPWMYGVNGAMAVFGSVLALTVSMLFGFTAAYYVGLAFYGTTAVVAFSSWRRNPRSPVAP